MVHDNQKANLAAKFTGKTDIEFIVDSEGHVIMKQARPFPQSDLFVSHGE